MPCGNARATATVSAPRDGRGGPERSRRRFGTADTGTGCRALVRRGARAPRVRSRAGPARRRRARARARRARPRPGADRRVLRRARRGADRGRGPGSGRRGGGRARAGVGGCGAGDLDGHAAAVPQGHRQGAPADRGAGGRAREADRAWRPLGEAGHGGGKPPARRLDREAVPQPGPAVPRPDPGGDDRPRSRGGEVRLAQGLQVLDVRDVVDPPGGRARDRGQGPHDPHACPRRREAQQDQPLRAEAARRARPRADADRDRDRPRPAGRGGRADQTKCADARLARKAGRRRGGIGVRALPHGRVGAASRRGGRGHDAPGGAPVDPRRALAARASGARAPLRPRRAAAADARRGRARLQRHARADPADRAPEPQEASRARRRGERPRRRMRRPLRKLRDWLERRRGRPSRVLDVLAGPDDDAGAGVREPRRPKTPSLPAAAAVDEPLDP